jgi:hypothetical protein
MDWTIPQTKQLNNSPIHSDILAPKLALKVQSFFKYRLYEQTLLP